MHMIGDQKFYSTAEAEGLSGLDSTTVEFFISAKAVKPLESEGTLVFSENDVLILKLISTLIVCKRSLRLSERLRRHFGVTGPGAERIEASAIARLVDQLLQQD